MTFRVGQKVVCVNATPLPFNSVGMSGLCERKVYTIRALAIGSDGELDVWLFEISRPHGVDTFNGRELPFCFWRFRPVVERKTDISIFVRMLTPSTVDA